MKKLLLTSVLYLITVLTPFAQETINSDTLNCTDGTVTVFVDLTNNPDSLWTSDLIQRDGLCCGVAANCVQFVVSLSPDANSINFYIPDGCGAMPIGSLHYQVDCGPITSVGTPICLDGAGPFVITFCKPGNNENCYSIQSISDPSTSPDIVTTDGCLDTLSINGVDPTSITWNSIFPGNLGDYNHLINNVDQTDPGQSNIPYTGEENITVSPSLTSPNHLEYQVCGNTLGACGNGVFCDTLSVSIVPSLGVTIYPQNPTICEGESFITLSANNVGGVAPYNFIWTSTQTGNIGENTQQQLNVSAPGEYSVTLTDSLGCAIAYDTVVVNQYSNPIEVFAGADQSICATPSPTITLSGSSPVTSAGFWTNGLGTFSTSNTDLNTNYTPSIEELNQGYAMLVLHSDNNLTCPGDTDTILISLTTFEAHIETQITNVSCFGECNGSVEVEITGIYGPYQFDWDENGLYNDPSYQNELCPGDYEVSVIDTNGCIETIPMHINEPDNLELNAQANLFPSGYNISCYSFSDGAIQLDIEGGRPEYSFSIYQISGLDTNLISANQITDSLSAGLYYCQVIDGNGCIDSLEIILNEPEELSLSYQETLFPSGDHISCFGLSDGTINMNVEGGNPPYSFDWSNDEAGDFDDSLNQIGLSSGNYNLVVQDAYGCYTDTIITLTEPDPLEQSAQVSIFEGGYNISCFGYSDGFIEYNISGGSPVYSVDWCFNGLGDINDPLTIEGLTFGVYCVTVTDINNCQIDTSISLIQPTLLEANINVISDFNGVPVSCENTHDGVLLAQGNGGVEPYSFYWNTTPTQNTAQINNLSIGNYTVTVVDLNGCETDQSVTLHANPLPEIILPSVQKACPNDTIVLQPANEQEGTCNWILENGMFFNGSEPHYFSLSDEGCYAGLLIVENDFGCKDTLSIQDLVCIYPNPLASFTIENNNLDMFHTGTNLWNDSYGGVSYEWLISDGSTYSEENPYHEFPQEESGQYEVHLIVTSEHGCVDSTMKIIEVAEELVFFIPNTFTPDNDQFNQGFGVVLAEDYQLSDFELTIFNRWGEILFSSNDINNYWDGKYNGTVCQDGTYLWKLSFSSKESTKSEQFLGHVNLIK